MQKAYWIVTILSLSASAIFGYLAFRDDSIPTSISEIADVLRGIDEKISSGQISISSEADAQKILGRTAIIAETAYDIAAEAGFTDLPILRLTDRPAPINHGDSAEFLLSNGNYVSVSISTEYNTTYVRVNGDGAYFKPGLQIPAAPNSDCFISLLRYDTSEKTAYVRAVCNK